MTEASSPDVTAPIATVGDVYKRQVYDAYGSLTGNQLESLNHREDPWIKARGDREPWESCSQEISEDDMKYFYRKLMK